jgi:pyrroline-5-carboxylate reductase
MATDKSTEVLALLGAGKMGSILLQALLKDGPFATTHMIATVRHSDRARTLSDQLGIPVSTDNAAAAAQADIILIGVKPPSVAEVIRSIGGSLSPDKLIISFAASVDTKSIEETAGTAVPVIRAMPNTPCLLAAGITALARGRFVTDAHMATALSIFGVVGRTVIVDERHMDAVTGLSGSGPAFIYIIIESLAEAGVKVGLPRDIATLLASQTTFGAAKMVLETGSHPALLKDAVTTPAGCTMDGILELEEGGLRVTLIKAVMRATERARQLAQM